MLFIFFILFILKGGKPMVSRLEFWKGYSLLPSPLPPSPRPRKPKTSLGFGRRGGGRGLPPPDSQGPKLVSTRALTWARARPMARWLSDWVWLPFLAEEAFWCFLSQLGAALSSNGRRRASSTLSSGKPLLDLPSSGDRLEAPSSAGFRGSAVRLRHPHEPCSC